MVWICHAGCLSQTVTGNREDGFLAFLRLIGTAYFQKHVSTFSSRLNCQTPRQLINSINGISTKEIHETWLNEIRTITSTLIDTEEERVPSYTALWRHWLRSSWISMMWLFSITPHVYANLPKPEESGWIVNTDQNYSIDWEDSNVQAKIRKNIEYLVKGCSCKMGCKTQACGCRKKGSVCGPSCKCHNCANTHITSDEADCYEEGTEEDMDDNCSDISTDPNDIELDEEIITDDISTYTNALHFDII